MSLKLNANPDWGEKKYWSWQGISCHWRVLGKEHKKTILLLHGFGACSKHWRNNANFFVSAGFRVYGLDLIGFGSSEQPKPKKLNQLDNKVWSNQVAAFLKEIIKSDLNNKTVLIGNSLGSLTAITTLAYNQELVSAVIAAPLADPSLMGKSNIKLPNFLKKLNLFFIKYFFKLLPLEIILPIITKSKLLNIALQFAYKKNIKLDYDLKRIVKHPAERSSAARALRSMCIGMSSRKKEDTAPELLKLIRDSPNRRPILLIWGKEDRLVPFFVAKNLKKLHPWIDLFLINSSGHCPHDECPDIFNRSVLNWLDLQAKII